MTMILPQSPATKSPEPSTQATSNDAKAPKKSRRQRQKAAKAKAAQDLKHGGTTKADQQTSGSTKTPAEKAERSLASLTIAEVKALKLEESLKKHYALNPPKAATAPKKNEKANHLTRATTAAKAKKTAAPKNDEQASSPAEGTTATAANKITAPKNDEKASSPTKASTTAKAKRKKNVRKKKAKQPVQYQEQGTTTILKPGIPQPPGLRFGIAPCGIHNCPVLAPHERRPYVWNEPARPNWVKTIQDKGDTATRRDWDNMDRFFIVHSFA